MRIYTSEDYYCGLLHTNILDTILAYVILTTHLTKELIDFYYVVPDKTTNRTFLARLMNSDGVTVFF